MSIDTQIDAFFEPISKATSSVIFYSVEANGVDVPLILIWFALAGLFFTIYLGFINVRYFTYAIRLLFGKGMRVTDDGEISQFQALMTSLSGTVGLGNIASVGVAISVGGPGAAFWMTVMGFLGMSTKFSEVMLGVKYRVHPNPENPKQTAGGPMYYIKAFFDRNNLSSIGTLIATLFCVFCILGAIGGGNMFQANQVTQQLVNLTGGEVSPFADYGWAIGLVMAFCVGIVIIGGLKSIANVSSKLVPAMAAIYVCTGLLIILINLESLPNAISIIISNAFSFEAGLGAFLGGLLNGIKRAAFSNESGMGSAAIVQSTTNTDGAVGTGLVSMLGPFIDTIIICNITALVIVITGAYEQSVGMEAVELTSRAFALGIPYAQYILTLCVVLFAYSTMIAWYYNAAICVKYIFGEKQIVELVFKIFYCASIVVGSAAQLSNLINFTDAVFLAMAIPNILALYLFAPEIKRDVKKYVQALKKS
ncbi:MAG: alanine glycine permease [Alphaproteobacteria bacterium]|nr:MAG: alanine glycine permease [Alphaproteobacteria bacterium]